MIASYGCVAQAEAYTKQWARNLACEIAIDRIIRSNPKARAIIKDLLVKQGTKVLRVVHKIIVTKPEVLNQEVEGYQVQAKTASLWNHLPQSVDSFSLQKALKGEPLIVEKLALFADSLGLRISWKISMQPEGHFQAECTFEGLRAQGLSYNRRSVAPPNGSRRSWL